jgi:hypothetical protein
MLVSQGRLHETVDTSAGFDEETELGDSLIVECLCLG